jgi:hypothetical protein
MIPPTSVLSGSSRTRFISWTDRDTRDTTAPCRISPGARPLETWLMTSDSAKTAQTPEMFAASADAAATAPICSVPYPR